MCILQLKLLNLYFIANIPQLHITNPLFLTPSPDKTIRTRAPPIWPKIKEFSNFLGGHQQVGPNRKSVDVGSCERALRAGNYFSLCTNRI